MSSLFALPFVPITRRLFWLFFFLFFFYFSQYKSRSEKLHEAEWIAGRSLSICDFDIRSFFGFRFKRYFRIFCSSFVDLFGFAKGTENISAQSQQLGFAFFSLLFFFGINFEIWVSNPHLGFGLVEQSIVDSLFTQRIFFFGFFTCYN